MYIKLPEEDAEEGMCGLLGKSLQGIRDAAQNRAASYVGFMEESGFVRGISSPCCFHHKEQNIRCVVHGDEFTVLGKKALIGLVQREDPSEISSQVPRKNGPRRQ